MSRKQLLKISEIFYSLQGESNTVGLPTVFVRLTGCPLRCQYCDTAYAFVGGDYYSLDEVVTKVQQYDTNYVTVTGGEPLAQPRCWDLLTRLCDLDYQVSLETSGAMSIESVDSRVVKVMDLKTPGSNEVDRNLYANIQNLSAKDQVKFVICDREDYEWAKHICEQYALATCCHILFSPSYEQLANVDLAQWILQDQLKVRFQIQQHKYIWGDCRGK